MDRPKIAVPWSAIHADNKKFIHSWALPEGVTLREPSKIVKSDANKIISFWRARQRRHLPVFGFQAYLDDDGDVAQVPFGGKLQIFGNPLLTSAGQRMKERRCRMSGTRTPTPPGRTDPFQGGQKW